MLIFVYNICIFSNHKLPWSISFFLSSQFFWDQSNRDYMIQNPKNGLGLQLYMHGLLVKYLHLADSTQKSKSESILHYAKGTCPFGQDWPGDPIWGIVGSILAPGSRPDGRTSEILEKSGKTGNFRKLHMTYQIKALCVLVHVDRFKYVPEFWGKKLWKIFGKTLKIRDSHTFDARRATTRECNYKAK